MELLRRFEDVKLTLNAPQSLVVTDTEVLPVDIKVLEAKEIPNRIREPRERPLLVLANAVLHEELAARLEDAGIGYFDAGGRRWLPGGQRTKRAQQATLTKKRGLYAASIRLSQLLADHPGELWTERGLANRGLTTQATAHRLLVRLEGEGLVERRGQGRGAARRVASVSGMRAWLAREGRPKRVARLSCYMREPLLLPEIPGRSFVLTGAVAAEDLGLPVLTSQARPTFRVNVNPDELENVPEALGGFRTEEGANLTLVADPDRLAFIDAFVAPGGDRVASPSRTMLDLYLEPRGEAAVGVFLDLWGEREVLR
jgi:hypothetical protein